jgi:hypothetical protein
MFTFPPIQTNTLHITWQSYWILGQKKIKAFFSEHLNIRGHRSCDRMVVGFTTIYAINAYHHKSCEFDSRSWQGVLNIILCDKVCQ